MARKSSRGDSAGVPSKPMVVRESVLLRVVVAHDGLHVRTLVFVPVTDRVVNLISSGYLEPVAPDPDPSVWWGDL